MWILWIRGPQFYGYLLFGSTKTFGLKPQLCRLGGKNLLGGETLDCTSIAHEGDMDRLGQWIGPVIWCLSSFSRRNTNARCQLCGEKWWKKWKRWQKVLVHSALHAKIAQNGTTLKVLKWFVGNRSGSKSGDLQSQESTISRCDKICLSYLVPPWILCQKIGLLTRQLIHQGIWVSNCI